MKGLDDVFVAVSGTRVFFIRANSAEAATDAFFREPHGLPLNHLYSLAAMKLETWEPGQVTELKPGNMY